MLQNIDVLVYDIQDIGCRSYTFISTLGLAMEAAGESGVRFCVLDRPDPLNGNRVEGPLLDPRFRSFTSQWNIPYVYGLTPGELAYMIHSSPGWIKKVPPLTIVSMVGWYRSMYWDDTGLMWIPTSPHIPTAETSLHYVATGMLGEAGGVSNGVGYTLPFAVFGHPSFNSFTLADQLNQMKMPGVYFEPVTYKPFYNLFKNDIVNGVQLFYTDPDKVNLCNVAVQILYRALPHLRHAHVPRQRRRQLRPRRLRPRRRHRRPPPRPPGRQDPEEIIASWQQDLMAFREARRPYLLYGERPRTETNN